MTLPQQITSPEVSLTLKKHGLPQEDRESPLQSSHIHWVKKAGEWKITGSPEELRHAETDNKVRAWTASELGEYLPPRLTTPRATFDLQIDRFHDLWLYFYESNNPKFFDIHMDDTPYLANEADARADLIDYLLTGGYAKVEELSRV